MKFDSSSEFFDSEMVQASLEDIKEHLKKNITTETLVILDGMLGYKKDFDDKLDDFVWKTVSMKLDKYKPFLLNNINLKKYKQTLKEIVVK